MRVGLGLCGAVCCASALFGAERIQAQDLGSLHRGTRVRVTSLDSIGESVAIGKLSEISVDSIAILSERHLLVLPLDRVHRIEVSEGRPESGPRQAFSRSDDEYQRSDAADAGAVDSE